jgi:hypothetical protein
MLTPDYNTNETAKEYSDMEKRSSQYTGFHVSSQTVRVLLCSRSLHSKSILLAPQSNKGAVLPGPFAHCSTTPSVSFSLTNRRTFQACAQTQLPCSPCSRVPTL